MIIKLDIEPIKITKTCNYLGIFLTNMSLGQNATFKINTFDEDAQVVKTDLVRLDGEDYEKWGDDDQYVIDYICQKLNIKKRDTSLVPLSNNPEIKTEPEITNSFRKVDISVSSNTNEHALKQHKRPFLYPDRPYIANLVDDCSRK